MLYNQSMLIKFVTKLTQLRAEQIWAKYVDVKNWSSWDSSVESSELYGDFVEGTKGSLKPVGGPKAKFILSTVTKYVYFSDRSFLPLAHIDFEHAIADDGETRTVTHTISLGGFLAPLFKLILGKKLADGLDEAVENLVKA
jgi:hypothetical protein